MIKPTVIAIPVFAALIGLEAWFTLRRSRGEYPAKDTWTNIFIGFVSVLFDALFGLGFIIIYTVVYEYAPYHFPADAWWSWAILFFADDLSYYWVSPRQPRIASILEFSRRASFQFAIQS